jgi:molybdopterin-binding protein
MSFCSVRPLTSSRVESVRNQLMGKALGIRTEGLLVKVVPDIGNQHVTAIITADGIRNFALKPGDSVVVLIKATEVMIGRP